MTFDPRWDESGQNIAEFDDIRQIQTRLVDNGLMINKELDPKSTGPASIMLFDHDGNMILIDQNR